MQAFGENLDKFTNNQLSSHEAALDSLMGSFTEQFASQLGESFNQLEMTLVETLEWHEKTRELHEQTWQKLEHHVNNQARQLEFEKEMVEARMALEKRQTDHVASAMKRTKQAADSLQPLGNAVIELTQEFSDSQSEMIQTTDALKQSLMTVHELEGELAEATLTAGNHFKSGLEDLDARVRETSTALSDNLNHLRDALEVLPERYRDLVREIRNQLHAGLKDTFAEFDDASSDIAGHLSGSYVNMISTLERLDGALDHLDEYLKEFVDVRIAMDARDKEEIAAIVSSTLDQQTRQVGTEKSEPV
jgi:chromosome segregation ATPase